MIQIYATLFGESWNNRYLLWQSGGTVADPMVYNPSLKLKVNEPGELQLTVAPGHPYYGYFSLMRVMLTVIADGHSETPVTLFRGRIVNITRDIYRQLTISAKDVLSFLGDTVQLPVKRSAERPKTPESLLRYAIDNHNRTVMPDTTGYASHDARFDTVEVDSTIDGISVDKTYSMDSYQDTWGLINSELIDQYGGYLIYEFSDDYSTCTLKYKRNYGRRSQAKLEFGVNVVEISREENVEDLFTVLIPTGDNKVTLKGKGDPAGTILLTDEAVDDEGNHRIIKNSTGVGPNQVQRKIYQSGVYLYVEEGVAKYGPIVKVEQFPGVTKSDKLLTEAINYIRNNYHPEAVTYTVTAVDPHIMDANSDTILLGDMVHVIPQRGDQEEELMVSEINYDFEHPEKTEYVVGKPFQTIAKKNEKASRRGARQTSSTISSLGDATATANATANNALSVAQSAVQTDVMNIQDATYASGVFTFAFTTPTGNSGSFSFNAADALRKLANSVSAKLIYPTGSTNHNTAIANSNGITYTSVDGNAIVIKTGTQSFDVSDIYNAGVSSANQQSANVELSFTDPPVDGTAGNNGVTQWLLGISATGSPTPVLNQTTYDLTDFRNNVFVDARNRFGGLVDHTLTVSDPEYSAALATIDIVSVANPKWGSASTIRRTKADGNAITVGIVGLPPTYALKAGTTDTYVLTSRAKFSGSDEILTAGSTELTVPSQGTQPGPVQIVGQYFYDEANNIHGYRVTVVGDTIDPTPTTWEDRNTGKGSVHERIATSYTYGYDQGIGYASNNLTIGKSKSGNVYTVTAWFPGGSRSVQETIDTTQDIADAYANGFNNATVESVSSPMSYTVGGQQYYYVTMRLKSGGMTRDVTVDITSLRNSIYNTGYNAGRQSASSISTNDIQISFTGRQSSVPTGNYTQIATNNVTINKRYYTFVVKVKGAEKKYYFYTNVTAL